MLYQDSLIHDVTRASDVETILHVGSMMMITDLNDDDVQNLAYCCWNTQVVEMA